MMTTTRPLAVLVNNSGFGLSDPFHTLAPRELASMTYLNITVLTLLTGATATRFADRASMGGTTLFKTAMPAEKVARIGITALLRGRRVRVPGVLNKLMATSVRVSPGVLVTKIAASMVRKHH